MRDIIAVRLFRILLTGLLSSAIVLVVDAYLESRAAALIAFLIPLMSRPFVEMMIAGTQPKLSITRLRRVYRRAELEKWVQDHYDKIESFKYESLYIRKQ